MGHGKGKSAHYKEPLAPTTPVLHMYGNSSPNVRGTYTQRGTFHNHPYYMRADDAWTVYKDLPEVLWIIEPTLGGGAGDFWSTTDTDPFGTYHPDGDYEAYPVFNPQDGALVHIPSYASPFIQGNYYDNGTYNGKTLYIHDSGNWQIWWFSAVSQWLISVAPMDFTGAYWLKDLDPVTGIYSPQGGAAGTPAVVEGPFP